MAVTTNLYPPIVDTYQKAFLINSEIQEENICRIYFSLSMFNSESQIKNVQVTIRNQDTNLSVLKLSKYPTEIMITDLLIDNTVTTNYKYYIEIKPEDIENDNFIIDQYYKVQLRFTGEEASNPPITENSQPISTWLSENLLYFSEWSTITLVRGISVPTIELQDFIPYPQGVIEIYSSIANTRVLGKLIFEDENETETLKEYHIALYDDNDQLLLDSGTIYADNYIDINNIDYSLNYILEADRVYYFILSVTTQNLYRLENTYYIDVLQADTSDLHTNITAEMDEENARAEVKLVRPTSAGSYTGQLIVRRSDSKTNFTIWDDMYIWTFDNVTSINETWYDYTIESGIFYKYAVQGINTNGYRTIMTIIQNPIITVFDHMFLTNKDKQLKIKFNPQISSFKRTLSESKIDTIGGKYPFIKRNGNAEYIQFPIAGFIASAMDEDGLFTTKEQVYGSNKTSYDNYNQTQEIPDYRDVIYEKTFRDKVQDFLYEDGVKLFRSPTEGNILIRLMDIQFQPNQTLGRRLWSFNGNAYEIDKCNINNFEKYKIIFRGDEPLIINDELSEGD